MILRARWTTAICICISLFLCPAFSRAAAQALPGGGLYVARPDPAASLAVVQLWYRVPSSGYDASQPGLARLAITAIAASSVPHATPLYELVRRVGGVLVVDVHPDIAALSIAVPPADAPAVLRAATAAFSTPVVTDAGRKRALAELGVDIAARDFQIEERARDRAFAALFAGPAQAPSLPQAPASLERIDTAQIRAFAKRAFRGQNCIVSVAGNVGAGLVAAVAPGAGGGAPMDAPYDSSIGSIPPEPAEPAGAQALALAWSGPGIDRSRETTALDFIASLLFDARTGSVALLARGIDPNLSVAGRFVTMHASGVFLVTVVGPQPERMREPIARAIAALSTPLAPAQFDVARNIFAFRTAANAQTPQQQAAAVGWYAAEGDADGAPGIGGGTYERDAASLDPAFVAATARRYLNNPVVEYVPAAAQTPAP